MSDENRIVEIYDSAGIKRKITMKALGELANLESQGAIGAIYKHSVKILKVSACIIASFALTRMFV